MADTTSVLQQTGYIRVGLVTALAMVTLTTVACTHRPYEHAAMHFGHFEVPKPSGTTVHVCHAYGCQRRTKVRFSKADMKQISAVMRKTRKNKSAHEERRAVAYAIGWMERTVGKRIGTSRDRPGMDFIGSGDPTQHDCVDEATNTTSYLTVLQNSGLLKHHTVSAPFAKENYLRGVSGWTHWTAVLKEKGSGQRWAVDSWAFTNGENPAVVKAEKWYIASLEDLPKPTQ
ncbi:MAG: hypothetical protein AAF732_01015 [Pseudomonadota bacterium]